METKLVAIIHIAKIDLLRGIAILSVFLFHCYLILFSSHIMQKYANGIIVISNIENFVITFSPISLGWSGVELFFIISGFLIHLNFLEAKGNFNCNTFYSKRFWRIYPPYFFALLFFSFSNIINFRYILSNFGLLDFILHVLLIHNLTHRSFSSFNPSFWSLALEAQLYVLYPFFLIFYKKLGIEKSYFLVILVSLVFFIMHQLFINDYINSIPIIRLFFEHSVLFYWFVWISGSFIAERYYYGRKVFSKNSVLITLATFICFTLCKCTVNTSKISIYFATLFWISMFELILYAKYIKINSFISKMIVSVGVCSYSIYLVHQPYLSEIISIFNLYSIHPYFYIFSVLLAFAVIYLISYSLYQFVEIPSIEFGKKMRNKNNFNITLLNRNIKKNIDLK